MKFSINQKVRWRVSGETGTIVSPGRPYQSAPGLVPLGPSDPPYGTLFYRVSFPTPPYPDDVRGCWESDLEPLPTETK